MDTGILITGANSATINDAATAIVSVLKAAETEAARVAACSCLAQIAKAPEQTTVQNCCFTCEPSNKAPRKGKRK